MGDTSPPTTAELGANAEIEFEQMEKNKAAIKLLQSWFNDDEAEQRDTLAKLCIALDKDPLLLP